jgi:hypothetical protein
MKGIVFTQFLEMVEGTYGYEMVDYLLSNSDLPSKGAYTSIGTYDNQEMAILLGLLHQRTLMPIPTLLHIFGRYLFKGFTEVYPQFFAGHQSAFTFLESVENYIHVEVRKLYHDAELPRFSTKRLDDKTLELIYHSERRLSDLAEGLISASVDYFQDNAKIVSEWLSPRGDLVKFTIVKH